MRPFLVAVLALAATGCGSSAPPYVAEAATTETAIDGEADEWPAALRPVPDEAGLSLGLRHTGDALIVAVIAGDDRQARRIALGGLRLWLDPEGGTDRALGIRYPAPEAPDVETVARSGPRRGGPDVGPDPTRLRRRFEAGLDEVEITRGVLTQRTPADGAFGGLEAASTWGTRGLVVEMRIPLEAAPGLLETPAGEAVGLGVELLDVSRAALRQRFAQAGRPPMRNGGDDRPMPAPDGQNLMSDMPPSFETVTRWLRVDLG